MNALQTRRAGERGFTLIEMLVALALFAVVMLIATGALLSLVAANKQAQSLQSVMNNLNIALDGMVRAVREGSDFYCSTSLVGITGGQTQDCTSGGVEFAFEPVDGNPANPDQWVYELSGGTLMRSEHAGLAGTFLPLTAPEISISSLTFYVVGSNSSDTIQPKVLIIVDGTAKVPSSSISAPFQIQATAVQRALDVP